MEKKRRGAAVATARMILRERNIGRLDREVEMVVERWR